MKIRFKYVLLIVATMVLMPELCAQTVWYDPLECDTPYVSGRAWNVEIGKTYARFPDRFKDKVSKSNWNLSRNSAGLSVRFVSNAKKIQVRYVLAFEASFYKNMAPLNHSGIDLYGTDANGQQHWIGNHMGYRFPKEAGDTITITYDHLAMPNFANRGTEFELFLPPYNTVHSLQIGVPEDATFSFLHTSAERPIVVYGTSIAQGASPSRPGLMWTTMLHRQLDYPVINLGFSGSAMMELPMFEIMGEIDARAYILDAIPNSHSLGEEIYNRAVAGIKKIREKSDAPILMVEACGGSDTIYRPDIKDDFKAADAIYHRAYRDLQTQGVKNLYYLTQKEIGMTEEGMIEGTHPNDIGNKLYADAVVPKVREMLAEDKANLRYPPVRQRRDGSYEWFSRHNEVIRLNHTTNPEILMIGNSITHFWGGQPSAKVVNGGKTWDKLFGKRVVTNMGFGWDRIENVYWRIFHGELEGCSPKQICLLIGVNNIGDTEEDISNGVVALAGLIRERQPQAKLHVLKIYPAVNLEEKIARVNALIEKKLVCDEQTDIVDLTSCLTLPDGSGKIDPSLFVEGLHPNEKGYAAIAKELRKVLK